MPDIPWAYNTIVQLTLIGVCDTTQIVNTHHFEASEAREILMTPGGDAAAVALSGEIADHWLANAKATYLGCLPTEYVLQMVKAQALERPGLFRHKLTSVERPQTTGNTGLGGQTSSVNHVAAVIKWRTPVAGKQHRGRSYIGPIPTIWMADGRLTTPTVTIIDTYAQDMKNTYGVGGTTNEDYRLTVYSRPYNMGEYQYPSRKGGTFHIETPPDYGGNSTNITAAQVDPILRSQRRRQLGVGS